MLAAKTNSIESVKLLLKKNADTSICDENNFTALTYGILSGNIEIIEILIRKTNSFLDVSLMKLAESKFRVNQNIKDLGKPSKKINTIFYDIESISFATYPPYLIMT